MKNTASKYVLIFIGIFFFQSSYSQISFSYFGNSNLSKVGVGYEFNDNLWTELRIYSGTAIQDITPEAVLNYNFRAGEDYKIYAGGGFVLNGINGIVSQIGTQIMPFEKLKNFSFHIELQPQYNFDFSDIIFYGYGGIRYTFN
jgi:hypothetical protein